MKSLVGLVIFTGILEQRLRCVLALNDVDELTKNQWNIRFRVCTQLNADFTDRPSSVVAHGNVLGIQVVAEDRKEVGDVRMHMLEARLCEIAEKGE